MSNPLDTDAGSEMFASYENELKLVQADLNQKLDQIAEASGEQRKAAIRSAEQVLDEATELVSSQQNQQRTVDLSRPRRLQTPSLTIRSWTKCEWKSKTSHLQHGLKSTCASATTPQTSTRSSAS
jgi:glutamyl-tRNA reductase